MDIDTTTNGQWCHSDTNDFVWLVVHEKKDGIKCETTSDGTKAENLIMAF